MIDPELKKELERIERKTSLELDSAVFWLLVGQAVFFILTLVNIRK